MRILITGGTGFIGKRLVADLQTADHELTVLVRDYAQSRLALGPGPDLIRSLDEIPAHAVFDRVINLAGAGIASKRWTAARKKLLLESRLNTTKALIQLFQRLKQVPEQLVSASAVGFYGSRGSEPLTETSGGHDEFTHELCKRWEGEAYKAESLGVKVCILRLGVVLGPGGGMLGRLLPVFRFGLGGRIGDGQQYLSWVHLDDVVAVLLWVMERRCSSVFNVTAPEAATNQQFTRELAGALRRPALLPMPAPMVHLMFGEMGDRLLLHGQNVRPERLLSEDYEFNYPDLHAAIRASI